MLEIAKQNQGATTIQLVSSEQTFSVRTKRIHFNETESILVYMQDITSTQKLQALEAQDRLTTMYSANVSHEMRTPLSTSINFTDLLLQTEKDPTKIKHLEIIKFSCILMLNNVNDTLDNAQIRRGTFQSKPVRCDIKGTLEEVVSVIQMQAASRNTTLRTNLPKKSIRGDK